MGLLIRVLLNKNFILYFIFTDMQGHTLFDKEHFCPSMCNKQYRLTSVYSKAFLPSAKS